MVHLSLVRDPKLVSASQALSSDIALFEAECIVSQMIQDTQDSGTWLYFAS